MTTTPVKTPAAPTTTFETAQALARFHRAEDPDTTAVYFFDAPDEVRLVEVSGSIGGSGDALPFRFGPQPKHGIHHPSVIILLTPDEADQVREGKISLPEGWGSIDDATLVQ